MRRPGMIRNIIFDLGGVIIKHRSDLMPFIVSSVFEIGPDAGKAIWKTHQHALLTGELSSEGFLRKIKDEIGSRLPPQDLLERWVSLYEHEGRVVNTALLKKITGLRRTYAVYLLTDTLDVHHAFNSARGLYGHFDGIYGSHLEGKSKSQGKDVFLHFLRKFRLTADECVFIDDLLPYIETAESVGIRGIRFTTVEKLEKDLKRIGVIL